MNVIAEIRRIRSTILPPDQLGIGSMSYAVRIILASTFLCSSTKLVAAEIAANATRDVTRLVACMKALDAACANSLTYTRVFEEHGLTRDKLNQAVTNLYEQLKSVHGAYSRLDLNASWTPFIARGRTYIFIPYSGLIKSPARNVSTTSFFIGISADDGNTWKFIDGQKVTPSNINMIIPGYNGGPMPPQALSELPP
jgi:hypothetical protein